MRQIAVIFGNHPTVGESDVAVGGEPFDLFQITVVEPVFFLGKTVLRNANPVTGSQGDLPGFINLESRRQVQRERNLPAVVPLDHDAAGIPRRDCDTLATPEAITNHAAKTDELCKITQAKCDETVASIELMLKNLGSQVDTKGIVQRLESVIQASINRDVIEPFLKRTQELATEVVPTLKRVQEASAEATRSWRRRIYLAAIWHGAGVGLMVALAAGIIIYMKFHDYYERATANRIAYAEQLVNYNQDAFKQLAIAQQPIKVTRTEENGVVNQGYTLEVPGADAVEMRVENGQTNGYVYFTSSLLEIQLQKIQKMADELEKANQQFAKTNSP